MSSTEQTPLDEEWYHISRETLAAIQQGSVELTVGVFNNLASAIESYLSWKDCNRSKEDRCSELAIRLGSLYKQLKDAGITDGADRVNSQDVYSLYLDAYNKSACARLAAEAFLWQVLNIEPESAAGAVLRSE